MSGYLDALQRMAGAPAGAPISIAAARAVPFATGASPSGPARDGAGAPGSMSQEALADALSAAQSSAHAAPDRAPVAAHAMVPSGSAQAAAPLTQGRAAAPDLARHGIDVSVHPAIQAALRWVSGDPFATPVDADRATPRQASSHASSHASNAANPPGARPASALARRTPAALSPDHHLSSAAHAPGSASPAAGAPSPAPSPFAHGFALDLALDPPGSAKPERARSRRAQADQVGAHANRDDDAASTQPDRVEISIGSIHVSVDAPAAPRSVAPPQPATAQAATQAAARANTPAAALASAHSAFSRSRLPRR